MIDKAIEVMKNSYSPYSKFKVGAAVVLKNGEIITGTNIENASYGLTMCAERVALFTAYAKGYRKEDIELIIVAGEKIVTPCGACRQVIFELMDKEAKVILVNKLKEKQEYKVSDLLPIAFEL